MKFPIKKILLIIIILFFQSCLKQKIISYNYLNSLAKKNDWDSIITLLESQPKDNLPKAHLLLALAYIKEKQYSKSLKTLNSVNFSSVDNQFLMHYLKAQIFLLLNDTENSLRELEFAIEKNPENSYIAIKFYLNILYHKKKVDYTEFLKKPQIALLEKYTKKNLKAMNIFILSKLRNGFYKSNISITPLFKILNKKDDSLITQTIILNIAIIADQYLDNKDWAKNFYNLYLSKGYGSKEERKKVQQRLKFL